jgi:hypothetical protein
LEMSGDTKTAAAVAALKDLRDGRQELPPDLPYAEVLERPRDHLGPFATLPGALRAALLGVYVADEENRTLARGFLSRALVQGGAVIGRALYAAERWAGRVQAAGSPRVQRQVAGLRRSLRLSARGSAHAPFMLRRWCRRQGARWQLRTGRRDLQTILQAGGFDTRPLGYEYLEGLRQVRGCEAVLRQGAGAFSQLIGIDFVQSGGRYWFLEANYNPALMDARLALYEPGTDPWVAALVAYALRCGLQRMLVYGYRPLSRSHAQALVTGGQRAGVEVTIIDDLFAARQPGHRRAWLMENGSSADALVVRIKGFDVLFDRAMLSKRQTRQILEGSRETLEAAGVALPRLIQPGCNAPGYARDSRYPSIVAKIDGLDRGAGVDFHKLPRLSTEVAACVDYCEEYCVPDPCQERIARGQRVLLPDQSPRAWKIRSYALLTPDGAQYLSSIKVISGRPVPATLPDGKVAEKNIYLATVNEGGVYSAVNEVEDQTYRRAVAAVGGVLLDWFWRKYAVDHKTDG